ncbi:oligosaccharide flippase family protein [Pannonibacter sp. TSB10GB1]|uniref:oligosaccharide flippase family protein n=2 Tax=unclassified Pannonibacter TaxID=2627228 RepID=UPI0016491A92|nr:oligosaccharide flippase family protein [Pannonibacter sp. TSB10GB1]
MILNMFAMVGLGAFRSISQFVLNLALAFFLSPADLGVISFVLPFVVLFGMMAESGLTSAIVKERAVSADVSGAALVICIFFGIIGASIIIGLLDSPLGAIEHPDTSWVFYVSALVLLLCVVPIVPRALMERLLQYRKVAQIEAFASVTALVICLAIAVSGGGTYALLAYHVSLQSFRCFGFLLKTPAAIVPNFRLGQALPLYRVGIWSLLSNLMSLVPRQFDKVFIGWHLGAATLGLYAFAYQIMLLPLVVVTWPVSGVLYASLVRTTDSAARAAVVRAVFQLTSVVLFPGMAFISIGLDFPVRQVLPENWHDVPSILAYLGWVGAVHAITSYTGAVLMSVGAFRAQFLIVLANTLATIAVLVTLLPSGMDAYLLGYLVQSASFGLAVLVGMCIVAQLRIVAVFQSLAAGAFAAAGGTLVYVAVGNLVKLDGGEGLRWGIQAMSFAAVFLATLATVWRDLVASAQILRRPVVSHDSTT